MTKASVALSLILLSACVSAHKAKNTSLLFTFSSIKQVFAKSPSPKQILESYGEPDVKENEGNKETWRYFDPSNQFDRVQFIFNESKTLVQLFWIPLPGEDELKTERIFEQYPPGYFKVIKRSRVSNHSLKTNTTYSGESVAIFQDDSSKEVQAVAWFSSLSKITQSKSNTIMLETDKHSGR
jgi:hypothetical protein